MFQYYEIFLRLAIKPTKLNGEADESTIQKPLVNANDYYKLILIQYFRSNQTDDKSLLYCLEVDFSWFITLFNLTYLKLNYLINKELRNYSQGD